MPRDNSFYELCKLQISPKHQNILNIVFNEDMYKLPDIFSWNQILDSNDFYFRELYTRNMFPIINHELLIYMKNIFLDLNIDLIAELNCGTGWFSHWMLKYGIPINKSVDNKSWHGFKEYLPLVYQDDSVSFVKRNLKYQMFILSWPYMDNVALDIISNMRSGQYLFYIGESRFGCTADDDFFDFIENEDFAEEIKTNINKYFLSFYTIRDHIRIYKIK